MITKIRLAALFVLALSGKSFSQQYARQELKEAAADAGVDSAPSAEIATPPMAERLESGPGKKPVFTLDQAKEMYAQGRVPQAGEMGSSSWLRVKLVSEKDPHNGEVDSLGVRRKPGEDSYGLYSGLTLLFSADGNFVTAKFENKGKPAPITAGFLSFDTLSDICAGLSSGSWSIYRQYDCLMVGSVSPAQNMICAIRDRWTDDLDDSNAKIKDPKNADPTLWMIVYARQAPPK